MWLSKESVLVTMTPRLFKQSDAGITLSPTTNSLIITFDLFLELQNTIKSRFVGLSLSLLLVVQR